MAYLTGNGADPVSMANVAAEAGYDAVSFRLLPAGPGDAVADLIGDDLLVREVMATLKGNGLSFFDAEMIRLSETTDLATFVPFLDRIAEMGARHLLVAVDDTNTTRATQIFGELCEMLAGLGLTANLEFMPWTGVRSLPEARRMVEAVNLPNAAVLFDALHFDRSNSSLDDLATLPHELINYVQICDGPVPFDPSTGELINVARNQRLIPGTGGINLASIVPLLPNNVPVSVEIPNPEARSGDKAAFARRALRATKVLMGDAS
ncbi:MAG: sugar phosphate isomerase/epimerase [Rhizobiaceae bacterium]|nr:sugar phosphate isomerase/epimerase [Rhizobiaceae bacterium]